MRHARGVADTLTAQAEHLAGWPGPSANEFEIVDVEAMEKRRAEVKSKGINGNGFGLSLGMAAVLLAGWQNPQVDSFRSRSGERKHEIGLD